MEEGGAACDLQLVACCLLLAVCSLPPVACCLLPCQFALSKKEGLTIGWTCKKIEK